MKIWLDAHLSPSLTRWIEETQSLEARAFRDLGLREAKDRAVWEAAKAADSVIMTKDSDFPDLLQRHGPPPRVIWLTCGNTSKANLQRLLQEALPRAIELLRAGECLIEIREP